jgi:hypothetical protein
MERREEKHPENIRLSVLPSPSGFFAEFLLSAAEGLSRLWNCERKLNTSLQMVHLAFLRLLLRRS